MFSLINSKSSGQHKGKFRGLLKFSLSNEAGICCYSSGKARAQSGKHPYSFRTLVVRNL